MSSTRMGLTDDQPASIFIALGHPPQLSDLAHIAMHIQSRALPFTRSLGLVALCAVVLLGTYEWQIGEANEYLGMQPWEMSLVGYLALLLGLPMVAWVISGSDGRPSDFFRLFYGAIVLTSFLVLHPVAGQLPESTVVLGLLVLFAPLLVLEFVGRAVPAIRIRGVFKASWIEFFVVTAVLLVVLLSATYPPASAGFGIADSYDRRLEGRDIYAAGTLLGYGLAMSMNGLAPYLGFVGGLRRRWGLLLIAVFSVVFFYWLLGVKAPGLYVIAAFVLGVMVRNGKIQEVPKLFLLAIAGLGMVVLFEWTFFDQYSVVADYFFRRLFAAQAEVQSYYLQFLSSVKPIPWSWAMGGSDDNFSPTYFIGEYYFDNPDSNVNTNAFLHALAAKGFAGYLWAIIVVALILVTFDRLYQIDRNPTYLFLGFLYGLLVVEQAYSVAFVSSGVGVLFLLALLEAPRKAEFVKTVQPLRGRSLH